VLLEGSSPQKATGRRPDQALADVRYAEDRYTGLQDEELTPDRPDLHHPSRRTRQNPRARSTSLLAFVLIANMLADVRAQSLPSGSQGLHPVDVVPTGSSMPVSIRNTSSESNTDEVPADFVVGDTRITPEIPVAFHGSASQGSSACRYLQASQFAPLIFERRRLVAELSPLCRSVSGEDRHRVSYYAWPVASLSARSSRSATSSAGAFARR
jgi:hypothetical protein